MVNEFMPGSWNPFRASTHPTAPRWWWLRASLRTARTGTYPATATRKRHPPARLGQNREQVADADEAGGKMTTFGLDVLLQILSCLWPQIVWQQLELQRHGVGTLRVALDAPVRRDIALIERDLDV